MYKILYYPHADLYQHPILTMGTHKTLEEAKEHLLALPPPVKTHEGKEYEGYYKITSWG